MYEQMANESHQAANDNNKIAMFHLQVLRHAPELGNIDPVEFCRLTKVPESYATEFRKMISLARLLREKGLAIS